MITCLSEVDSVLPGSLSVDVCVVQNTVNGQSLQVTASTFMPSQGKLACGRTDGSIILVPAVETIVLHLLDGGQELGLLITFINPPEIYPNCLLLTL